MILATDSTSILSICFSGGSGRVLVMTRRLIGLFFTRSTAGPLSTPCVAMAHTSVAPRSSKASAADTIVPPALRDARAAGLMWDGALLERFLADPEDVFPGTWMGTNGLRAASDRAAVMEYLRSGQ